ncbi:MAG TPA: anti-sigma factor [Flavisolibacter sp.]|nr:anti-sigma factor [Flavisolibacter sp.]
MNVKEYISSGVVESYVLGLLSEPEKQEFEAICAQYPEVLAARTAFELALEEQLMQDAIQPPSHLKQQVLERLSSPGQESKDVYEEDRAPVRRIGVWKWVAAASLLLLAGAAYLAFTANSRYENLRAENEGLRKQLNESSGQLAQLQSEVDALAKPGMKLASLKGTVIAPEAQVTIFWDTTSASKDVYLMVNNLPQPASDKQYQLWALLDGQPIDLGVFDTNLTQRRLMVKMKNVQNAQAFAITLEPKGGSVNPTLDSMYVMGSL